MAEKPVPGTTYGFASTNAEPYAETAEARPPDGCTSGGERISQGGADFVSEGTTDGETRVGGQTALIADTARVWTDHPFSQPGWGRRLHRVWWEMSDKLPTRCLHLWRPLCARVLGGHLPEKGRTGKTWCSICDCWLRIDGGAGDGS